MRGYFKDSRAMAHSSLMVVLFLLLLKFNSNIQVAARSAGGQRLHIQQQQQQQPLHHQHRERHLGMHVGGRQAINLPIWHSIFPVASTIESSRAVVAGTDTATTLALADVSKRRHIAGYDDDGDDDDDIDIEHVDDDGDGDDDYADNFENFRTRVDKDKSGMELEAPAAHPEFVYIKPKSKSKPTQRPSFLRSRLFALNAQATTPAPLPPTVAPPLGRNVDRPTQSPDKGRTFFHHKGQAGPQFIVLTTPLNLTNINNNNITTGTTTTVAPGGRFAFIDDGYAPTGLYRKPILRQTFRRRAQPDNALLPYGLLSTWDDNAQVLPLAAAAAVMQGGGDLRYVPLDLRRLSASHAQTPAQVQLSPGYASNFGGSDDDNSDDNENENDDFGNALGSNNAGYSRFSAPWRSNPNRFNAKHRNVYENPNPFATFANSFRRVQYL